MSLCHMLGIIKLCVSIVTWSFCPLQYLSNTNAAEYIPPVFWQANKRQITLLYYTLLITDDISVDCEVPSGGTGSL